MVLHVCGRENSGIEGKIMGAQTQCTLVQVVPLAAAAAVQRPFKSCSCMLQLKFRSLHTMSRRFKAFQTPQVLLHIR